MSNEEDDAKALRFAGAMGHTVAVVTSGHFVCGVGTLIAELAAERAKVKKLREALEYGLTKLDDPRVEIRSNKEMALAIEESFRRLRSALAETAE